MSTAKTDQTADALADLSLCWVYISLCWFFLVMAHIYEVRYMYNLKGRFLMLRKYHNFANLCSKLSESTFYKEISKFQ